jgi:hypothetical protein
MDERTRRVAANEAVFRELKLAGLTADDGTLTCVCECGDLPCVETIVLSRDDYRRIRADATTFVIRPGQAKPGVEDVVEATTTYEIVRKKEGEPAELARETV